MRKIIISLLLLSLFSIQVLAEDTDCRGINDSDCELAKKFAPILKFSTGGEYGVNVKFWNVEYPYSDYIPMSVYNLLTHPERRPKLRKKNHIPISMDRKDLNELYKYSDYDIDLSPIWEGLFEFVVTEYLSLKITPTVYFRVFRNESQVNPIAIQYWFYYFYNDWLNNHPGDWETITIFLNKNEQPVEIIYSTHYEANRYTWNLEIAGSQPIEYDNTHPVIYVSNGGHGSYSYSGNTAYSSGNTAYSWVNVKDNHDGEGGDIKICSYFATDPDLTDPDLNCYKLVDLKDENWLSFSGNWGSVDAPKSFLTAPKGPIYRSDATRDAYDDANNKPRDPYNFCEDRFNTRIYGNEIPNTPKYGPWYWAVGYPLNGGPINVLPCKWGHSIRLQGSGFGNAGSVKILANNNLKGNNLAGQVTASNQHWSDTEIRFKIFEKKCFKNDLVDDVADDCGDNIWALNDSILTLSSLDKPIRFKIYKILNSESILTIPSPLSCVIKHINTA